MTELEVRPLMAVAGAISSVVTALAPQKTSWVGNDHVVVVMPEAVGPEVASQLPFAPAAGVMPLMVVVAVTVQVIVAPWLPSNLVLAPMTPYVVVL
jgi:hypothetical protein